MRRISNKGNIRLQNEQFDALVTLFTQAKNENESRALLETLLTPSEKAIISQRLAILRLISKGLIYADIENQIQVAPGTIAKAVDQYLKHGQYNAFFDKLVSNLENIPLEADYKDPLPKTFPKTMKILREAEKQTNIKEIK